jgi:hypothetical protein
MGAAYTGLDAVVIVTDDLRVGQHAAAVAVRDCSPARRRHGVTTLAASSVIFAVTKLDEAATRHRPTKLPSYTHLRLRTSSGPLDASIEQWCAEKEHLR